MGLTAGCACAGVRMNFYFIFYFEFVLIDQLKPRDRPRCKYRHRKVNTAEYGQDIEWGRSESPDGAVYIVVRLCPKTRNAKIKSGGAQPQLGSRASRKVGVWNGVAAPPYQPPKHLIVISRRMNETWLYVHMNTVCMNLNWSLFLLMIRYTSRGFLGRSFRRTRTVGVERRLLRHSFSLRVVVLIPC